MRRHLPRWLRAAAVAVALATGAHFLQQHLETVNMHAIPAGLRAFDVSGPLPSCGRWKDTMPKTRDPAVYRRYIEARNLWRSMVEWQLTRAEALRILDDVRATADQGDWGARALLAHFYRSGLGPLEKNHVLDPDPGKSVAIVRAAVAAGQAWGYYDLGVAHEQGYGGAVQHDGIAWAYYRKAAELGSPEAQMVLASAYLKAGRDDAEEAMLMCAYRQGHGPAAYDLGITAEISKDFVAALEFYQAGTRFGSSKAAAALMLIFNDEDWSAYDRRDQAMLKELGILPDQERVNRYSQISNALDLNPDLKLSRLDQVVPLPPADLPAWLGVQDAVEPQSAGPSY